MDRHGNHPEPSSQPDAYTMQGYGAAVGRRVRPESLNICYQTRGVHRPINNVNGIHESNVAPQIAYGTDYPITPDYRYQNIAEIQYTDFPIPDLDSTQFDGYRDNPFTFVPGSAPFENINAAAPIAAPVANTQYTSLPGPELGFTRFDGYLDHNLLGSAPGFVPSEHIGVGPIAAPTVAGAPLAAPIANSQYTGFQESGSTQFDDFSNNNLLNCARPPALSQSLNAGPDIVPTITAAPPARPVANRGLACTHVGCTQRFQHQHDLTRHIKGHKTGAKDFNCPYRDCPRQGMNGYTRKDKLMDHLKGKHKW